jgi:hypothetical protein
MPTVGFGTESKTRLAQLSVLLLSRSKRLLLITTELQASASAALQALAYCFLGSLFRRAPWLECKL